MMGKSIVRVIGKDYPSCVLHGTTRVSAKAFKAGTKPERVQRTMNEWGSNVILASERDLPHQALMFSGPGGKGYGGRVLMEFRLRPGAEVLDVSREMHRVGPYVGDGGGVMFANRPSFTEDMGRWLNESRKRRGVKPIERPARFITPGDPDYSPTEYLPMLASYARDRGYDAVRMADELAILNRDLITEARVVPKGEKEKISEQPIRCGRKPPSLFTKNFDCPPTPKSCEWRPKRK